MINWMYDEFKHCGVDYSDKKEAGKYNTNHQSFRNYEKEFNGIIDFLGLQNTENLTMIDLGCGTGAISRYAARRFKKVHAIDVSNEMINLAKKELSGKESEVIEFHNAGFLSYQHTIEPVDIVCTKAAFHHLPDFWKQIALLNINQMLKTGGIFYIFDVVFDFEPAEYQSRIDTFISNFEHLAGSAFRKEVETHIRDEYSTFRWILDGMLQRAGFNIVKCRCEDRFTTEYHCVKV